MTHKPATTSNAGVIQINRPVDTDENGTAASAVRPVTTIIQPPRRHWPSALGGTAAAVTDAILDRVLDADHARRITSLAACSAPPATLSLASASS